MGLTDKERDRQRLHNFIIFKVPLTDEELEQAMPTALVMLVGLLAALALVVWVRW